MLCIPGGFCLHGNLNTRAMLTSRECGWLDERFHVMPSFPLSHDRLERTFAEKHPSPIQTASPRAHVASNAVPWAHLRVTALVGVTVQLAIGSCNSHAVFAAGMPPHRTFYDKSSQSPSQGARAAQAGSPFLADRLRRSPAQSSTSA